MKKYILICIIIIVVVNCAAQFKIGYGISLLQGMPYTFESRIGTPNSYTSSIFTNSSIIVGVQVYPRYLIRPKFSIGFPAILSINLGIFSKQFFAYHFPLVCTYQSNFSKLIGKNNLDPFITGFSTSIGFGINNTPENIDGLRNRKLNGRPPIYTTGNFLGFSESGASTNSIGLLAHFGLEFGNPFRKTSKKRIGLDLMYQYSINNKMNYRSVTIIYK
jgi:hypothetical protein